MRVLRALLCCAAAAAAAVGSAAESEQEWWESTVFYQIYPRSFMDSDGDGIGDLNGITSRLEHLRDIGVGATWLSPIFKSPMYDFGYDIADFYQIQDEYGTMEDFERLVEKANELDIKLILDFVPNHTSNESVWFEEALKLDPVYYDYFIWEDGVFEEVNGTTVMGPPNNWISVFRKSAWEYREEVGKYYLHQFVIGQPDLNYRNPAVVEEMKDVFRFWLEKGVAGFRVDAINHLFEADKALHGGRYPDEPRSGSLAAGPDDYDYLDHVHTKDQEEVYDMVYQWRDIIDEYSRRDGVQRVMMTEAFTSVHNLMRYFGDGAGRQGAHMPFNFDLITDVDGSSSANDVKRAVDKFLTYKPIDRHANWVIGNHDQNRVGTRYGPELVDALNMLVMLLPGVAVTYMGEEIGMVNGFVSWEDTVDPAGCNTDDPINYWMASRDPARTPFQWSAERNAGFSTADRTWLPVAAGYETLNLEAQRAASRSHYHVYRALTLLRQEPAFRSGRYHSVALNQDVFAFQRWTAEESYVVVMNMRDEPHDVDLTYFDGVSGELLVAARSVLSPREVGEALQAARARVWGGEALALRAGGAPPPAAASAAAPPLRFW